jgi:hypothetical protein
MCQSLLRASAFRTIWRSDMKSVLTTEALMKSRMKEAAEGHYYNSLYKLSQYAFGMQWANDIGGMMTDGQIPDFPPLPMHKVDVGQFRGIWVNQFIAMTKNLTATPKPVFSGIDEVVAELRQKLWQKLYNDGNWGAEMTKAFLQAHCLGVSFIRWGLTTLQNGKRIVKPLYQSVLSTLWDAHEASPQSARWIAFVLAMPPEEAEATWPNYADAIKASVSSAYQEGTNTGIKRVRVVEYIDKTTRRVCLVDKGGGVDKLLCLEEGPNPYGGELGFSCMEYLVMPEARRPIGTAILQLSSAEELQRLFKQFGSMSKLQAVDVLKSVGLSPESVKLFNEGKTSTLVLEDEELSAADVLHREEPPGITATQLQYYQMQRDEFSQTGNANEYERNVMPAGTRTKYEVELYNAKTSGLGSWSGTQTLNFQAMNVRVAFMVAEKGMDAPVELDYDGQGWTVNNPRDPLSSIQFLLEDEARVSIDETSMRATDKMAEMNQELSKLSLLSDFVKSGQIAVEPFVEKMLTTLGITDLDKWKPQPQAMPQGVGQGLPQDLVNAGALPPELQGLAPAG